MNTGLESRLGRVGNHLQPWTNFVGKCIKTSTYEPKTYKIGSDTPIPPFNDGKWQNANFRHMGRGKMRGEQNFPTLVPKVVVLQEPE